MTQNREPKKILCIYALAGVGRVSLCAVMPVLSVMGHQAVPLPTTLLSTHTGKLGDPAALKTDDFPLRALEHYKELGLEFDCIFSGYLSAQSQLETVLKAYEWWPNALKIADPVMGDDGKIYRGLSEELCAGMKELCRRADVILPNLTEACYLLGLPMPQALNPEEAQALAAALAQKYTTAVVTGLPMGEKLGNAGAEKGRQTFLVQRLRQGRSYHGTGDLFAGVLAGALLNGNALSAAVDAAAGFVADCIAATPADTNGQLGVWLESQLYRLAPAAH